MNPATGVVIAEVAQADKEQVDQAVCSAARLFAATGAARACASGQRICVALPTPSRSDSIALLPPRSQIPESRLRSLPGSTSRERQPISASSPILFRRRGWNLFRLETPDGKGALNYAVRKPLGVVGIITPGIFRCCCSPGKKSRLHGMRKRRENGF